MKVSNQTGQCAYRAIIELRKSSVDQRELGIENVI
jgi:hypothetical protein